MAPALEMGLPGRGHRWVAGVRLRCHQSSPPAQHTQAAVGGLEICIGYRGGGKGSSGARPALAPSQGSVVPAEPGSPSPGVSSPHLRGMSPQPGPAHHQDATQKSPSHSLLV